MARPEIQHHPATLSIDRPQGGAVTEVERPVLRLTVRVDAAGFEAWASRVGSDGGYRLVLEGTAEDVMLAITGRSEVPMHLVRAIRPAPAPAPASLSGRPADAAPAPALLPSRCALDSTSPGRLWTLFRRDRAMPGDPFRVQEYQVRAMTLREAHDIAEREFSFEGEVIKIGGIYLMTCRHKDGDPACSTKNPEGMRKLAKEAADEARAMAQRWGLPEDPRRSGSGSGSGPNDPLITPDAENYEIVRGQEIPLAAPARAFHLVLEVAYPNCARCAYEGRKVLVFLSVTATEALRWRRIDPHFRPPASPGSPPREAPSPAARFPATEEGWADAVAYAKGKAPGGKEEDTLYKPWPKGCPDFVTGLDLAAGQVAEYLDRFFAWDQGAMDSGILDSEQRDKIFSFFRAANNQEKTTFFTEYVRRVYRAPYTIEDISQFIDWLEGNDIFV